MCVFLYLVVTNWFGAFTHSDGKLLFPRSIVGSPHDSPGRFP